MELPGPVFYKLSELAKRWRKTEDDLLHLALRFVLKINCLKMLSFVDDRTIEGDPNSPNFLKAPRNTKSYKVPNSNYPISYGSLLQLLTEQAVVPTLTIFSKDIDPFDIANDGKMKTVDMFNNGMVNAIPVTMGDDGRYRFVFDPEPRITRSDLAVMAEEVARLEAKYPELLHHDGDQEERLLEGMGQETAVEMVKRLKLEGVNDKTIAMKLKKAHPSLSNAELGKLFADPGTHVTHGAHQKRGKRLLGKAK